MCTMTAMLASFGLLEWIFVALLVGLVGAAGVFGLYILAQLFRTPVRRAPARRPRGRGTIKTG
jgi:hypothetical protein